VHDNYKISVSLARYRNLEGLQFLKEKNLLILTEDMFHSAMQNCDVDMMQFLYDLGCPKNILTTINTFATAYYEKCEYSKRLSNEEFLIGIRFLEKWGLEWDCICITAAEYGDLKILKYAHKRGSPLTIDVINNAAYYGYLHIIIWLRKRGCKWNAQTCGNSIASYNFDILKWLINHNNFRSICPLISNETEVCPWDMDACRDVSNYNALKFAVEYDNEKIFTMEDINDYF